MCAKTLNDIYFETEEVYYIKFWITYVKKKLNLTC